MKKRAYEIAKNCGYDGDQRALACMIYKFFDKKTVAEVSVNEQLLHKPAIKKFKRRNVYARLKDSIWAADLTGMKSLSSKNKNVKYSFCVTDVFTKYVWVETLKDKKGKTVLNVFIEIANDSNCKLNILCVDQERDFYNKLMQEWLDNNNISMYATHNKGKSVIAKRFIKTQGWNL